MLVLNDAFYLLVWSWRAAGLSWGKVGREEGYEFYKNCM